MAGIWDELGSIKPPTPEGTRKAPEQSSGNIWEDLNRQTLEPSAPQKRGVLGAANDYVIELTNQLASFPKAAIDIVKPGTAASAAIGRFIEEGEAKQSDVAKAAKAKLSQSMQSEDLGEQALGALQYVKENPLLAASQAIGSFIGPGAAIKGSKMIGGALGLTEKGAARAGLAGGSTAGAVLAGGEAAGDAYQMVKNAPELQDLPIEQREQMATAAARKATPVPFVIGAASGLVGADKAFAAGTKSILRTAGVEAGSEFIEEGATKLSANLAAGEMAPSIKPLTGVVGSATLGGLLGGGTGVAVGALTRTTQTNSLLPGSTDVSTGEGKTPDENAINKAIDANSSEILVGPPPRETTIGPPTPTSEQVLQAEQVSNRVAIENAQAQAAQQQAEAQAAFDEISSTYGVQPTQVAGRYTVAGKTLFSQADATKFLADLDALNQDKTPEQKSLIGAVLSSGAVKVPLKSTAKAVNTAAVKFLSEWGIDSSADKAEAAERADVLINTLEGPKALKEADELNNFYKALTGRDAPAFVALQELASQTTTKGAKDGQKQLRVQSPAGIRAVSEQGGTTEAGGGVTRDLRPDEVRPIGAGSNLILPSAVQDVGQGSVRTRVEPSASRVSDAVPSARQEQEAQVIPDDRLEAIERVRDIVNSAFGTRDGNIVMEYLTGEKTSVQIANEYGVSDARIAQIAGPKAQETWGARIFAAAKRLGYTKDQVYNLLVISTAETETTTETEALTEEDLDFEAAAAREAAVSDEAGPTMAEEAAMAAEGEQTLGREETGEKEGGGASGFRVFNPQESGATELEDASAANRTYQKFKKQGLQALKDFELNNLAIDERITDAEIEAIVKEINRREEIRIGKGEESAVQKRSAKRVPVRKQAEAGKRVPSEDTEGREAAAEAEQADEEVSARTLKEPTAEEDRKTLDKLNKRRKAAELEVKKAEAGEESRKAKEKLQKIDAEWDAFNAEFQIRQDARIAALTTTSTLEERARDAWDSKAEQYGMPSYDALPEQAQLDWKDSVETGNTSLADMNKVYEDNQSLFTGGDAVGTQKETSLENLRKNFPVIDVALKHLDTLGISNAVQAVTRWATTTDANASDGAYVPNPDGTNTIIYREDVLNDGTNYSSNVIRHEIAHAIDMAERGGVYSGQPEFALETNEDGTISATGEIAEEMYNLYLNDEDWSTFLEYPFDHTNYERLANNPRRVKNELFAQLFAAYTHPKTRKWMYYTAPKAYKFMSEVITDVRFEKQISSKAAETAERRALGFAIYKSTRGAKATEESFRPEREGGQPAFEIKQSVKKARDTAAEQVAKLPKPIRGPLQEITDNIIEFAKKGLPFAAFTEDLADVAAKYIPSAKKYVQLVKGQQAIRTSLERRIDQILQQYDALPNEVKGVGENSVNAFIKDSTMKGEWGYDPNIKGAKVDPELKARFDAMPDAAQNLIRSVFDHGVKTLKAMQDAVISNINTEYDALIAAAQKAGDVNEVAELTKKKANSLTEYRTLMRMGSKAPYAPLKRFGNYVVVGRSQAYLDQEAIRDNPKSSPDQVAEANKKLREMEKNQDHYFVQFAETMGEAKAISRDEETNYALVEPFEKDSSRGALFGGSDVQGLFYRLRNMVEESQDSNTADKSERTINRLLSDLHLSLLSEQSARQSEKRRRKIAGAEKDMMRAFATQGRATAHFISSLENSEEIYDALRDMKQEARKGTEGTRAERSRYYNEFMKRHVMNMDYEPSPFIDKALNTTSVWMLLTNPAYFVQNSTQPFMMSLPLVGAKHGYDKSWKEFSRAYLEVVSTIRKHGLGEDSYNKLPADVRDVIEELVNRGRIDISLEQDLGRWRSTEDSKLNKFGVVTEKLRGLAQDIESINRVATAVAAYRLEARTNNKANAINYADNVIYRTHGDYSGFNAPRISRKGLGRLATQFRKFQLIQLSLMARLFNDAFAGQDEQTRQIGKRALTYTIGHTAVVGGIMGLPGFTALAFLYGLVFGDEDEPDNPELAMRRAIGDDTLADLLVKGVPAALGVDVSGKLGMGQMLSILPYTDVEFSRKGIAQAGYALMTGPFGGLTLKAADGISLMGQGDYYKGLEQLMPTGVAQAMKGYRFATEGVTSRAGDVLISPDEISFLEGFMVAAGLPTKQLTDKQFLQSAKFEYDQFYNDKASEIKRAYVRAYKSGDGASLSEARQEWEKLQQSRVRNGYTRQPLSNLLKAPQEQSKRERGAVGGVQTNRANRGFVRQTSEL